MTLPSRTRATAIALGALLAAITVGPAELRSQDRSLPDELVRQVLFGDAEQARAATREFARSSGTPAARRLADQMEAGGSRRGANDDPEPLLRELSRSALRQWLLGRDVSASEIVRRIEEFDPGRPETGAMLLAMRTHASRGKPNNPYESFFAEVRPGTRVNGAFVDAPLPSVLDALSRFSDKGIVLDGTAERLVTVQFKDVAPANALRSVLDAANLTLAEDDDGDAVRVSERQPDAVETRTYRLRHLVFGDAPLDAGDSGSATTSAVVNADQSPTMVALRASLGPSGTLQYEPLNRTLVATDTVRELEDLERVLETIDTPPKQVLIQARIVEISLSDLQELGIDWDLTYNMLMTSASRPLMFPFGRGADPFKEFRPDKDPSDSSFPSAGFDDGRNIFPFATSEDFSFGALTGGDLGITVNLSEILSNSELLSSPRVLALDGRVAHMQVGDRIPIPTLTTDSETGNTVVTGFQEERVGIVLDVIPFVLDGGLIQLTIHPEVSTVSGFAGDPINQRPIVSTREVTTQVVVRDGSTLVIGGLISAAEIERMSQVPWISRIPLFGRLFRNRNDQDNRTELVIFITVETRTPSAEPSGRERELLEHGFRGSIRGAGKDR